MEIGIIALIVFVSLFAIWLIFYFIPVGLWFSALVSGVRISLLQLILMRWRKVPPSTIVSSMIESTKAGLELNPNELEAHYLAGGNVTNVVHALVSAQKANIMLDFKMATAIDLAGRDVFEAVQMSVNPKVINTPPVAAVAKDGIQLIAKARVTVRANIKQLVGGAGEETVLARVGEGIVSSIGSAQSHKIVLENPDSISRVVLEKGLDAGTAFEILSIDIADIDVGKNIGAQLGRLPARGHRGDDRLPFAGIPDGAPQEDPHEQHDRTAEPGDPASHARRRQFPGRQQRVDAHLRQNQVRHRERMEHAPLPRHVPAR